ncbi:MAG: TniB family NTP-binding protein [Alicyclobacillus sp.]|nr:TniB family NTP-binding protein [Alicyclobacillus sp.]
MNVPEIKNFAERISDLYVEHPKVKQIWRILDSRRSHRKIGQGKNSPMHLFVIGDGGVGKTQMALRYINKNPEYTLINDAGTEIDIKPIVYVEVPNPFTIGEFYQSIVKELGAPPLSGRPTIGEIKRQAFTLLEKQQVEMMVLDEMDHILSSQISNKAAMDAIKHVANQSNVSLVCMGTPASDNLRKLDFQIFRRLPVVRLDRFAECDQEFCNLLANIEEQISPPRRLGLGSMESGLPQLLHRWSKGIVGLLTPIIQEAYARLGVFDDYFDFEEFRTSERSTAKAFLNACIAAKEINGDADDKEFDRMLNQ